MTDALNEVANKEIEKIEKKIARSRSPKVRKHLVTTAYKQEVADKLDKLHAAGHTILSITSSADVRGFEIVSFTEE